ncbi:hypothetical protein COLO4_31027 [Corchorus olitorius]|uniref:Uncharacterized protein n=1 Tax=Corchorus olitorius TaxID=93759 RepID=A0A1R3H600_9ROSI|nr:hypothetical protein COLO4_31027 [Corchorus olitorius]
MTKTSPVTTKQKRPTASDCSFQGSTRFERKEDKTGTITKKAASWKESNRGYKVT